MKTGKLSLAKALTLDRVHAERVGMVGRSTPLISTPVGDVDEFAARLRRFAMERYGFQLPTRSKRD